MQPEELNDLETDITHRLKETYGQTIDQLSTYLHESRTEIVWVLHMLWRKKHVACSGMGVWTVFSADSRE